MSKMPNERAREKIEGQLKIDEAFLAMMFDGDDKTHQAELCEALTTALGWGEERDALVAEVERLREDRSTNRWALHSVHYTAKCSLERLRNMTKPDMMKVIGQTRVDLQMVVDRSEAGSNAWLSNDPALSPAPGAEEVEGA